MERRSRYGSIASAESLAERGAPGRESWREVCEVPTDGSRVQPCVRPIPRRSITVSRGHGVPALTASRSAFPALNDGAVEAAVAMLSPVAGLRP